MSAEFKFTPTDPGAPLRGQITVAAEDMARAGNPPGVCHISWSQFTRLTCELGDAPCYSNEDGEEGLVIDTAYGRLRILPRVDFG